MKFQCVCNLKENCDTQVRDIPCTCRIRISYTTEKFGFLNNKYNFNKSENRRTRFSITEFILVGIRQNVQRYKPLTHTNFFCIHKCIFADYVGYSSIGLSSNIQYNVHTSTFAHQPRIVFNKFWGLLRL